MFILIGAIAIFYLAAAGIVIVLQIILGFLGFYNVEEEEEA